MLSSEHSHLHILVLLRVTQLPKGIESEAEYSSVGSESQRVSCPTCHTSDILRCQGSNKTWDGFRP